MSQRMGQVGGGHSSHLVPPPSSSRAILEHVGHDWFHMVLECPQWGKLLSLSGQTAQGRSFSSWSDGISCAPISACWFLSYCWVPPRRAWSMLLAPLLRMDGVNLLSDRMTGQGLKLCQGSFGWIFGGISSWKGRLDTGVAAQGGGEVPVPGDFNEREGHGPQRHGLPDMVAFCHMSDLELWDDLSALFQPNWCCDSAIPFFFTRLGGTQRPTTTEHPTEGYSATLRARQRPRPGASEWGQGGHGGRGAASPTSRPSPWAFRAAVGAAADPLPQGPRPSPPSLPGSSSGSSCVGPRASPGGGFAEPAGRRWVPGAGAVLAAPRCRRGSGGSGAVPAREALEVLPGKDEDARARRDGAAVPEGLLVTLFQCFPSVSRGEVCQSCACLLRRGNWCVLLYYPPILTTPCSFRQQFAFWTWLLHLRSRISLLHLFHVT